MDSGTGFASTTAVLRLETPGDFDRRLACAAASPVPSPPPSPPAAGAPVTKAGADLYLLLLRGNVPSGEIFVAKTDRELALLAIKYHIPLPQHLAHLPLLPPPRSDTEKKVIAEAIAVAEEAVEKVEPTEMKDRPPRRGRLALGDVKHMSGVGTSAPSASPSPPPSAMRPEELLDAAANAAPRRKGKKSKKGKQADATPQTAEGGLRHLSRVVSEGVASGIKVMPGRAKNGIML